MTQRLPVDLRVARGGVAVPDVVKVDLWQPGPAAASFLSLLVIVSGWGGLPSSRQNSTP